MKEMFREYAVALLAKNIKLRIRQKKIMHTMTYYVEVRRILIYRSN